MRLAAARVAAATGVLDGGEVQVQAGRVVAVEAARGPVPDRILVPGFVDLQVNGVQDVDVNSARGSDWERLDELLLASGVTSWCPTLVTAPLDSYAAKLTSIAEAAARPGPPDGPGPPRPAIVGAHVEGPFLSQGARGAHRQDQLRAVDLDWLVALPPIVRVLTLAPELDGALDAIRLLAGRGVLVALGHSTATFEQVEAAVDAGAGLVTHLFNAMPPLHHRSPGLVGAGLADDRLVVSLIADLVHVHPAVLRAALTAKGGYGAVLVTDSVAWRAGRAGTMAMGLVDGAPRLADGTLAGSALTMDEAVRNVARHTDLGLDEIVDAAATRAADLLGLDDRGRIEVGARADLVAMTPDLEVEEVWVGGASAWRR